MGILDYLAELQNFMVCYFFIPKCWISPDNVQKKNIISLVLHSAFLEILIFIKVMQKYSFVYIQTVFTKAEIIVNRFPTYMKIWLGMECHAGLRITCWARLSCTLQNMQHQCLNKMLPRCHSSLNNWFKLITKSHKWLN